MNCRNWYTFISSVWVALGKGRPNQCQGGGGKGGGGREGGMGDKGHGAVVNY